ncbi:MAG TPA: hypothetical protein VGN07_03765 [Steroidobacteraceae bacterium]
MQSSRIFAVGSLLALAACAATPPGAVPVEANVSGAWTMTVESPIGTRDSNAEFSQAGERLSGRVVSRRGEVPINGTVKGDDVAFGMNVNMRGQSLQIDYTGKVAGDAMSGTVKFGDFGDGKWTAKKKAP